MIFLKAFIVIILLYLVQSNIGPLIQIKGITPDFILVFMVFWSMRKERHQAVILGFTGGLLQDCLEGGILGVFALSKSIACYLTCSFPWTRYERNVLISGITLLTAALTHQLIIVLTAGRNAAAGFLVLFLRYGIPIALYTVFCGLLIQGLFDLWKKANKRGI